jgi:hypothetical protein
MLKYHKKLDLNAPPTNNGVEEPPILDSHVYAGEAYMELAAQYRLDPNMIIGNLGENQQQQQQQMVDEEYQAYVTAPCSMKDVYPLKFWEVHGDINGA